MLIITQYTHNFTEKISFEAFTIHVDLQNIFADAFKIHLNEELWCENSIAIWLLVNTIVLLALFGFVGLPTLCKETRKRFLCQVTSPSFT